MLADQKIVITAAEAISGNEDSLEKIWEQMFAGIIHRSKIDHFPQIYDPALQRAYSIRKGPLIDTVCGSPLSNEELAEMADAGRVKRYDRHQLFAMVLARRIIGPLVDLDSFYEMGEVGIIGATGGGGLMEVSNAEALLAKGDPLDLFANLRYLPNIAAGHIANRYGLQGPSHVHVTACAASAHALQDAVRVIRCGEAPAMVVYGTEAAITPFGIASFAAQGVLSNDSQPYQKDRKGFLMGEGAAMLLIETEKRAKERGATIWAEIAGYGATTNGNPKSSITAPDKEAGEMSAFLALSSAGIRLKDVAYINTHGTGTQDGDVAELLGIKGLADSYVEKEAWRDVPISSTKSFSGHLLGAAGAFEIALCAKMFQAGYILPTAGLTKENVDPQFAEFNLVMGEPQRLRGDYILSNSFGFGGTNASVVLKRPSVA